MFTYFSKYPINRRRNVRYKKWDACGELFFFCYFLFFFDVLVAVEVMVSLTIACEQTLRSALAAGREKEERQGELAWRLLKPQYGDLKVFTERRVTPLIELLGESKFHTFPFKTNHLHEKQKDGSARRVTHPAGSAFLHGRVTLLVVPNFLHFSIYSTLWLALPDELGQSETIRACASAVGSSKGVNVFLLY